MPTTRSHSLTAAPILLACESKKDFQLLLADYMDQFHPRTPVETDLVEIMAISRWRLRRLLTYEASLFDDEMQERDKSAAWVFQKFADHGRSVALLLRYEAHLTRSFDKALRQLLLLRSKLPNEPTLPQPQKKLPNEPTKPVGQVPDLPNSHSLTIENREIQTFPTKLPKYSDNRFSSTPHRSPPPENS